MSELNFEIAPVDPFALSSECDLESEQLCNYVASRRAYFNLTQSELASLCGCSKNTISSIENGSNCSIGLALRLSCVLHCNVDDLFFNVYCSKDFIK